MQFIKLHWVSIITLVVLIGGAAYAVFHDETTHRIPQPTGQTVTSSTTSPITQQATSTNSVGPFPINPIDTISSWNFTGAYTGNTALTQEANADITKLTGFLGKGQYDDYDLYIGLGDDNNLLGDGKDAYANYNHAIRIYPNQGLAYANLGHLMDELGAYQTAVDAYAKAVAVEPSVLDYQVDRLEYLTQQFPTNNTLILGAFTDASNQFGDDASILSIEAQWLAGQGRYADAIKAWQKVKELSPPASQAAIDAEIAQLTAKE